MLDLQNENCDYLYQPNMKHLENDQRKKILVIDDEVDFRLSLAELLSLQGYGVCTARDGLGALSYLVKKNEIPDLIILDLNMPRMNGWEFLKTLDADPRLAEIPLMIISGDIMAQDQEFSGRHRPVLFKPLDKLQMLSVIEKLLKT